MKTQQTDNNPPIVGPAAKWREVMEKADQIKVGDTLEVVADHRTAAPAQAQHSPKGAPTWGNDGQDEARAQAFIEGKNFAVAHAQRLADACGQALVAMAGTNWPVKEQLREALAEWSKSL